MKAQHDQVFRMVVEQELGKSIGQYIDLCHCRLFPCRLNPESGKWVLDVPPCAVLSRHSIEEIMTLARSQGVDSEVSRRRDRVTLKAEPHDLITTIKLLGRKP